MRILSMTATFGKLEHKTLTLEPGLNVIQAPNEWGKSTWCAFLLAMLYGLDTRAKTTRNALADKEHFAPWSGSPMSGKLEICWNDREITIERTTKGRIPMGIFRAYETKTGLDVPELNASNCGQQLLGVEQSVFRRAGFIRLSDLPVTQDDALRRRLNALVTTGDESGDGARLEKGLKEQKNRIRYNRSGLLPQLEQEREGITDTLQELEELSALQDGLSQQLEENALRQERLENHMLALRWQKSQQDARQLAEAKEIREAAQDNRDAWQQHCGQLPSRERTLNRMEALREHRQQLQDFQEEQQLLSFPPRLPRVPRPFLGMEPAEAMEQAAEDARTWQILAGPIWWLLLIAALVCLAGAGVLVLYRLLPYAIGAASVGGVLLMLSLLRRSGQMRGRKALARKYGSTQPEMWMDLAREYYDDQVQYRQDEAFYQAEQAELTAQRQELQERHAALCGDDSVDAALSECRQILVSWDALADAEVELQRAQKQYSLLSAVVSPAAEPVAEDALPYTAEQTRYLMDEARAQQRQLVDRQGEYRGRMAALGSRDELIQKAEALTARIAALERTYAALELAQQTLAQASAELQRRFAPRITQRAQGLLSQLTGGRYDRLSMGDDMTLRAGTEQEVTLCDAQWRSEGTIDQLYLTLRLAVAEELTPDAPLILDDALVRFDDSRLQAALKILQSLSASRQVILFTCQEREKKYLER